MIFSNNMEYTDIVRKSFCSFFCTGANKKVFFNRFIEEPIKNDPNYFYNNFVYNDIPVDIEKSILSDFNSKNILNTSEYETSKSYLTNTNKILTSLCSKERILFLIKYGIAYLTSEREEDGKKITINHTHIARYQQLFACLAVKEKLDKGIKLCFIWHTQGSGKTALSYYLVKFLTNYFSKKNKVAKFYFIVDRIDLLEQAKQEFETRGLSVKTAVYKKELLEQFSNYNASEGNAGRTEIVVVNIQRFSEHDKDIKLPPYSTKINIDKDSIKIALTGTPLLKDEWTSMQIFGDYIHTYYYYKSINDGYTLKIIREDIDTYDKNNLKEISKESSLYVQKNEFKKSFLKENDNSVKVLLRYIIKDFYRFRKVNNDNTLGAMIICDSSGQAKKINDKFDEIQQEIVDDKETRKKVIAEFNNKFKFDVLIVNNMLLTGFERK
ncbi:DEAD/DEAH box helicase family protein [Mycoplasmopsis canis]